MTRPIPERSARKRLFIKSYGCQMNVYDSARMADVLRPLGYEAAAEPDGADMVILNTCHIREKAAEKVFSELGRIRPLKEAKSRDGGRMIVAVAGCVAQAEGAEITARAPFVDIVLGPQTYHRLPELIARTARSADAVLDTEFPAQPKFDHLPPPRAEGPTAFLSIQEGCDKFCTFCVVPYTRGAEFSRPVEDVVAEARVLVSGGVKEITLLGQNVNAYHGTAADGSTWGLGRLLRHLAEIDGLARLRYTTSHPRDMDDELMFAHRDLPQVMPFLHLPVQSGSDRILASMNRGHTHDDYRRIVERLRTVQPNIRLSSDFIAGYPGETDADFAMTLALIEETGFIQAFFFKYSARPGTPAAAMPNQIPEPVKSERLAALQKLIERQQRAFNLSCVGRTFDVLMTGPGRHAGQLVGRTPYLQPVHARADASLIGRVVPLTIAGAEPNSLAGVAAIQEQVPAA